MSREERRAYQRMTKHQDPYAPPPGTAAQRARLDRQRAKRAAAAAADPGRLLSGRGVWWVFGGGLGIFLIGLSLAWPRGASVALLIGAAAGLAWVVLTMALAVWRRRLRMAAVGQRPRSAAR